MGNCLDRTISEDDEMPIRDENHNSNSSNPNHESSLYLNNSTSSPPSYYQTSYSSNPLQQQVKLKNLIRSIF